MRFIFFSIEPDHIGSFLIKYLLFNRSAKRYCNPIVVTIAMAVLDASKAFSFRRVDTHKHIGDVDCHVRALY